jgi:hypothetical protein
MKRKVLLLPLAAALTLAAPAFAQEYLLNYDGFDYDVAAVGSTRYLDVGDQYFSLGHVTSVYPGRLDGAVNFLTNEYTYHIFDLTVVSSVVNSGLLVVTFDNANGRTRYYEDLIASGTPADYGTNPPDAGALATFTDGLIALGGKTYSVVVTYDPSSETGGFVGCVDFDEGTGLALFPPADRAGWIVSGGLAGPPEVIPAGYDHHAIGFCYRPASPTIHKTWGAIKAMYR